MKNAVVGIFAHVDAGKTTLSEAILYKTGVLKRPGRVDNGDTFLDTDTIEKKRGITVFAGQAEFTYRDTHFTLLDTPGHVDFSAETERIMQAIDCAVLVVSGTDGVQSHTKTLFNMLKHYNIPVFIFVTKTDLKRRSYDELIADIKSELSESAVSFCDNPDLQEELSLCSEELLEKYLEGSNIEGADICSLVFSRRLFPCFFGSGLKNEGIEELLSAICDYLPQKRYTDTFGARVFKITRDKTGAKLTHIKITGGTLNVRDIVRVGDSEEKVSGIRIYSGSRFSAVNSVDAGRVCTVLGLEGTYLGQGLGKEAGDNAQTVETVMSYRLILPDGVDANAFMPKLKLLMEEEPVLDFKYNSRNSEISVSLMGEVQTEVLKAVIEERFGVSVETDKGSIIYKETVKNRVEGVGHYEPLRHYAEVHLIIEPQKRGTGLVFDTKCREEILPKDYQRLVLTHLSEKQHLGVLTGSPLADVKITLAAGRAHIKHTEGGDFRQATYRAVRQGLMNAQSVLLEPFYSFRLEVPSSQIGRAISDVKARFGTFSAPEVKGDFSVLSGKAPVSTFDGYAKEVAVYTSGEGRLFLTFGGYDECHNAEEVISSFNYDPAGDLENTPDSVFCAHGGGFTVKWNEVPEYMHLESCLLKEELPYNVAEVKRNFSIDDKELEAIMEREFGKARLTQTLYRKKEEKKTESTEIYKSFSLASHTIVDGYNVIFSWEELKKLAETDLEAARIRLCDILSDYAAFTENKVIVVFDAYNVEGGMGEKLTYNNIFVAYTKEDETGDTYIEKLVSDIGKNERVRVVTSDGLIQLSSLRFGVMRMSSSAFFEEVEASKRQMHEIIAAENRKGS